MPKPSIKPPQPNFSSTAKTKVEGKMNATDAGTVGKMHAAAYIIAAMALPLFAIAALIFACR